MKDTGAFRKALLKELGGNVSPAIVILALINLVLAGYIIPIIW